MYETDALDKINNVKNANLNLNKVELACKLIDLLNQENKLKKEKFNKSDYLNWQNQVFNLFLFEIHELVPPNTEGYNEMYLYDTLTFRMLIDYFNTPRLD